MVVRGNKMKTKQVISHLNGNSKIIIFILHIIKFYGM